MKMRGNPEKYTLLDCYASARNDAEKLPSISSTRMNRFKSEFLQTLSERGFIHQCTDLEGLDALMLKEKITAYIGFDCTAPSLHVGSLMQIMVLRWLQKTRHKPIVLMGGGTTKIGDPTGKDESRKVLSDADIASNMTGIKKVFAKFMSFGVTSADAVMVNNDDWLRNINLYDYLRGIGPHFSINRMLTMDSVKLRLEREHHLSFLEFNYMILQALDFHVLNGEYSCKLQVGGSDQWGNIIAGTELQRHLYATKVKHVYDKDMQNLKRVKVTESDPNKTIFGLTTPLITTASGAKMGKTESGAVWLNADMCSPFDYWQFWRNTEDADVGKFLRFFTELPLDEITRLEKLQGAEINEAKKILANEATKLCHGEQAATDAAETAKKTFELGIAAAGLPEFTLPKSSLDDGSLNPRVLLLESKLAESGGDAKKLIQGGGVKINDVTVSDPNMVITASHIDADGVIKLSKGKKHHVLIRFKP
jgi:tyrosyl-tRNA synthetase